MDLAADLDGFAPFMWSSSAVEAALLKLGGGSFADFKVAAASGDYPLARDLLTVVPAAAAVMAVSKFVLERAILRPVVRAGLRMKLQPVPFQEPKLEAIYEKHKPLLPDMNEIKSVSKAIDKPVEDLNAWFRARQRLDRDAVKVRVSSDCLWRLIMYSVFLLANFYISRGQVWSRDLARTWEDLPLQRNEESLKWFYVALEIPLYVVLLISQVVDGRQARDMWEMTLHHSTVLMLLAIIYLGNFVRIGMVGLILHDVTDIFLEASKLASSFRWKGIADTLFVGFAGSWAYARLYRVATGLVPTLLNDGRPVIGETLYMVVLGLLAVIVCLNLFWFTKISALLYRILWGGSPAERATRDFTDFSTDDDVDSDSSYFSDVDGSSVSKR
mmetsp:Transcript_11336/g.22119  ORF Transcript_11336/g.22119 Transcript_11336/m.22119 type:complete len:386 (+) Transcript_11336:202-1359(+)|eukprot:CAMPEP_0171495122 /NCGR_PEP_ID=MMETSP0958-20121227/5949_1 /TAXON_ID=87120 /ORGANISM="Aurantiochytrium limacinum, Strain ATCCMYA-1381" /LENGTH=385 /DNA_ID=CAMNT_0012029035 /DNA_START=73 /DNA_END=1230 /DNA_ORIENTATION=+